MDSVDSLPKEASLASCSIFLLADSGMVAPSYFDFNTELQREIPDAVKVAIADVVIAWAQLDVGLTQWFGKAFGMRPFEASVAIGRMDNKTKLERLQKLHEVREQPNLAQRAKSLSKTTRQDVGLRNAIAHTACIGVLGVDQNTAVFMTQIPDKDNPDSKAINFYSIAQMEKSSAAATKMKMDLMPVFLTFERGLKDMPDN